MADFNPDKTPPSKTITEWDEWMAEHPDLAIVAPNGVEFKILPPERWPDVALEALQDEKVVAATRIVLGARYDEWASTGANAAFLMSRIEALAGVTPGESSASSS